MTHTNVSSSMRIWFYQRECQVGDYVYYDGSFSDILNKAKTVVGVCFYIDPQDSTNRLCVAVKNLTAEVWGLDSSGWSGGIALADNPGYSVFDIPTLTNKNAGVSTISATNFRDDTSSGDADGFKVFLSSQALGEVGLTESDIDFKEVHKGDKKPWGLINTLKIVAHRNIILSDSNINLPLPQSDLTNLMQLMQNVVNDNAGAAKYRQYYYPAASQCNVYEPGVAAGETLADHLKKGKWFLPSAGELARIYWWNTHNKLQETVTNGIFAKAVADGKFTAFGTGVYWVSNEYNSNNILNINFANGNVGSTNYYRSNSNAVRAVAAF